MPMNRASVQCYIKYKLLISDINQEHTENEVQLNFLFQHVTHRLISLKANLFLCTSLRYKGEKLYSLLFLTSALYVED